MWAFQDFLLSSELMEKLLIFLNTVVSVKVVREVQICSAASNSIRGKVVSCKMGILPYIYTFTSGKIFGTGSS